MTRPWFMKSDVTESEFLAYVAGLFDGEGCVGIYGKNPKLYVSISNTMPDVLEVLRHKWEGRIRKDKPYKINHRPLYTWSICTARSGRFLEQIRPYSIIKAMQIDLALQFQSLAIRPWGGTHGGRPDGRAGSSRTTPEELAIKMDYAARMKALKGRIKLA